MKSAKLKQGPMEVNCAQGSGVQAALFIAHEIPTLNLRLVAPSPTGHVTVPFQHHRLLQNPPVSTACRDRLLQPKRLCRHIAAYLSQLPHAQAQLGFCHASFSSSRSTTVRGPDTT